MEFLRRAEDLGPGDHACLVYDSDEKREAALDVFFGAAIARGDRIIYLAEEDDRFVGRLRGLGADGQLTVFDATETYLRDGEFEPSFVLESLRQAVEESIAKGFPAVTGAGGPPPMITSNGHSHLLPSYERRVQDLFADERLVALCVYDTRRTDASSLLGIVEAHPYVLYALGEDERLQVTHEAARLVASGWLDITTVGSLVGPLAAAIDTAVAAGEDVEIDLEDVGFVDLAGLRLFAEAASIMSREGRRLTLVSPPPSVEGVVDILGYNVVEGLVLR